MQVSHSLCGEQMVGCIQMIQEGGFSGIADTIWVEECLAQQVTQEKMLAKSNVGV
jgi:hypothetical protein